MRQHCHDHHAQPGHRTADGAEWRTVVGRRRRRSFEALIDAAAVKPGQHVRDVGCGTGYFARLLARAISNDGLVVGADASSRFGGPRHLAMATESRTEHAELAHPSAVAPNDQASGGPVGGADDQDDMNPFRSALDSLGNGPVLACAWDRFSCGIDGKKIDAGSEGPKDSADGGRSGVFHAY